jgi:hypothetical protein
LAYDRDPAHYEPGDFFIDDRRDILAIESEAPAPLDVERLARALQRVIDNGDALALFREDAAAITAAYEGAKP